MKLLRQILWYTFVCNASFTLVRAEDGAELKVLSAGVLETVEHVDGASWPVAEHIAADSDRLAPLLVIQDRVAVAIRLSTDRHVRTDSSQTTLRQQHGRVLAVSTTPLHKPAPLQESLDHLINTLDKWQVELDYDTRARIKEWRTFGDMTARDGVRLEGGGEFKSGKPLPVVAEFRVYAAEEGWYYVLRVTARADEWKRPAPSTQPENRNGGVD